MASTIRTPGHDRQAGKVPHKEWFVDRDVLDRHDPLFALELEHAVNQQKRIPVRQNLQNVVDVEPGLRSCPDEVSGTGVLSFIVHVRLKRLEDYTVRLGPLALGRAR